MDKARFDALTRELASGATRRRLLGGLAGSAAVLGLGGLAAGGADAKNKHKHKDKDKDKKCSKKKKRCGGKCVNTNKSAKHCGGCHTSCGKGGQCTDGVCTLVVVTDKHLNGWSIFDNEPDGKTNGSVEFVTGPDGPPLGNGSVELSTPIDSDKATLVNTSYDGLAIADLDKLGYSTYMQNGAGTGVVDPAIKLPVTSTAVSFTTLVYEPTYDTGPDVAENTWQSWDLVGDTARWWSTHDVPDGQGGFFMCNPNGSIAGTGACSGKLYVPWATVLTALPDAAIAGGLLLETGSGSAEAVGNADKVIVNDTTYDFEPEP